MEEISDTDKSAIGDTESDSENDVFQGRVFDGCQLDPSFLQPLYSGASINICMTYCIIMQYAYNVYKEIDILAASNFAVKVVRESLHLIAAPIDAITAKSMIIVIDNANRYLVRQPNMFEHNSTYLFYSNTLFYVLSTISEIIWQDIMPSENIV